MMVVVIANIEKEGNVPFILIGAIDDLIGCNDRIGDKYGFVVFRDNGGIQHLDSLDTAFNAANRYPVTGFERLENQDEQARSKIGQIALHCQTDGQAKGAECGQERIGRDSRFIESRKDDQGHDGIINHLADEGNDCMIVIGVGHHADGYVFESLGDITADNKDDDGIDDIGTVVQ